MERTGQQALVVEGGAMRGIFAAGVLDCWLHHHYQPFDLVLGVSAGATNSVGYLCRQPGRSRKIISRLARTRRFFDPRRFALGGHLADVAWLWHESRKVLPLNLGNFDEACPLLVVITDVATGQPRYLQASRDNLDPLMLATCALPLVYKAMPEFEDKPYTDGGMSDSIPVAEAYRRGARDITVVLSHPLGYRKKPSRLPWLTQRLFKDQPQLAQTLLDRAKHYNAALDFIESPPADCRVQVVAPPPDFAVGRLTMDKAKVDAGYRMGLDQGLAHLQRLGLQEAASA
ncbi:patatin-like phospholipase family protein [Gallaecimonas xiamenensis]|uniref:patatin-like phospholipase family protein n=1 Tax=Gallaecimonas xiamenensis TaxID=1207039 RepID=UPI0004BC9A38|nr:patatin family protein [Gallaecimonas xiamenensis]